MKITRQTETELEVQDSMLWMGAFFVLIALVLAYAALRSGDRRLLYPGGLFLLFAFISLQKSTFIFDSARRMVTWRVLRYGKTSTGSIAFDELRGVTTESIPGPKTRPMYRLTLQTTQDPIPLAAAYGGGEKYYAGLRERINGFLKAHLTASGTQPASAGDTTSTTAELESYIRLLLQQGRKIDAVELLRSHTTLSLTEADQRITEVEKAMGAGK